MATKEHGLNSIATTNSAVSIRTMPIGVEQVV